MQHEDLLTADELAAEWRVSKRTILLLIEKGCFPNTFRAGSRQYRIPRSDVNDYLSKNRIADKKRD